MQQPITRQQLQKTTTNPPKAAAAYGEQNKSRLGTTKPQCYKCKGFGHFARLYPNKRKEGDACI